MAPEVMIFKEFNEKCDVYSFGIGRISLGFFVVSLKVVFFFFFFQSFMGNCH